MNNLKTHLTEDKLIAILKENNNLCKVPEAYDGSYEVVQKTVKLLANVDSSKYNSNDVRMLASMTLIPEGKGGIGWDTKIEQINKSNLEDKDELINLINQIKSKVENGEYENDTYGMFHGVLIFKGMDNNGAKKFLELCVNINNLSNENEIFEISAKVLSGGIKGLGVANVSQILHCIKPHVFPILNGAMGNGTEIYDILGINLIEPLYDINYIDNSKIIKKARDERFSFVQNYRAFDLLNFQIMGRKIWRIYPSSLQPKNKFDKHWEIYKNESIVGIGWLPRINLNDYKTKEEIKEAIIEIHDMSQKSLSHNTIWNFVHSIKIGDIIIASGRGTEICGVGIIESDYIPPDENWLIDDSLTGEDTDYFQIRKVKWCKTQRKDLTFDYKRNNNITLEEIKDMKIWDRIKEEYCGDDSGINKEEIEKAKNDKKLLDQYELIYKCQRVKPRVKNFPWLFKESLDKYGNENYNFYNEKVDNKIKTLFDDYFNIIVENPQYTKENFLNEVVFIEKEYDKLVSLIKRKKNIILQGSPGVGKTFIAKRLAYSMMGEKDESRVEFVQFHQSYSYEDFIQGYRPSGDGFELNNGVFYDFCKKAIDNPDKDYFFIIDEINRGNISKIFGELMMLIEEDKRREEFGIHLTYYKEGPRFYVPENLYIIGMMNTADRSLAIIDYALRRRFVFYLILPLFDEDYKNDNIFKKYLTEKNELDNDLATKIIDKFRALNEFILKDEDLGYGFRIGHSYFCGKVKGYKDKWYKSIINYEIAPLLREYWFDDLEKAEEEIEKLLNI